MTPAPFHSLDFIDFEFGTRHSVPPPDLITVHQVHSARVVISPRTPQDADAIIESTPGLPIGVKTADCVPILLADPVQRVVAAVHAGWRGTAAAILSATIRAMSAEFAVRPQDLHAAIGPAIGPCCYEVGPEVASEFAVITTGQVHLNLPAMNARQLEAAGVPANHIWTAADCTRCHPDRYHSFRRDRESAGRLLSWIRLKPAR